MMSANCGKVNRDYSLDENGTCTICDTNCQACQNDTSCFSCATQEQYAKDEDGTCIVCNGTGNFIQTDECLPCLAGCITCSNTTACEACDETNLFYEENNTCHFCNDSIDNFISGGECVLCALDGCLNCASLTECEECDRASGKALNEETKQCEEALPDIVIPLIGLFGVLVAVALVGGLGNL